MGQYLRFALDVSHSIMPSKITNIITGCISIAIIILTQESSNWCVHKDQMRSGVYLFSSPLLLNKPFSCFRLILQSKHHFAHILYGISANPQFTGQMGHILPTTISFNALTNDANWS